MIVWVQVGERPPRVLVEKGVKYNGHSSIVVVVVLQKDYRNGIALTKLVVCSTLRIPLGWALPVGYWLTF
jgi:hypothetical protein